MKKLFTEPDIEILSFLCETPEADSVTLPGEDEEGAEGILP